MQYLDFALDFLLLHGFEHFHDAFFVVDDVAIVLDILAEGPPCENAGEVLDVVIGVGLDGIAVASDLPQDTLVIGSKNHITQVLVNLLANSANVDFLRNARQSGTTAEFEDLGALSSQRLAGHTTSPTVVDWDQNGKPDLLIGGEDGFLYYMKNPN